ncbi:protein trichome birefringence-like 2 isoform X2 [Asparagus officinalis]|uniref:protein trichome birefringence-like 2 isoform X2 n=1 Tax=Asparagus officinalis TaxID=4686 RepID=UPI00098E4A63|nr:protein trichome birefringence-like 2 isoform X2 [Asparagus officinalis]
MDLKNSFFFEHFSFKRRVLSGFGLALLASLLIFSLFSTLSSPSTVTSSSSSSFFSWVFSSNSASNSTKILLGPVNGNSSSDISASSDLGMNSTGLVKTQNGISSKGSFSGKELDLGNAHPKNSTGESSNSSSFVRQESILGAVNGSVEQVIIENKPLNSSSSDEVERKDLGSNIVGNKNVSSDSISEKTQDGNSSRSSFSGIEMDLGNAYFKNSSGKTNNSSSLLPQVTIENVPSKNSSQAGVEKKVLGSNTEGNNKNVSNDSGSVKAKGELLSDKCNIFNGRWVRDETEAFYPGGSCPYIDIDFDCHKNGRPDDEFLRWRWQPNDCDIPRNMWESLVCILRHSVKDKRRVYEASGKHNFKTRGYYSFKFKDYDCSVDYVRSTFLVRELYFKNKNGSEDERLRLDLLDETTSAYREADVIVFNTGHWWTHEKTSSGIDYYQEGNHVYPVLKVMKAYTKALTTWANWVDKNIDSSKTQVVFRGYSLTHFRGGQWNSGGQCHKETEPIFNETFLSKYPAKMRAAESVFEQMKTPVIYLNISRLTDYRKDGHPSIYRKTYKTTEEHKAAEMTQDCSHWCLPGIPDTWNELLYASLLLNGKGSWRL